MVVLGTVFLYHGELTIPVVIALCLLVCTLTMVIGGIALYHETAYFVGPIEEMDYAVNQIAKGDFEVRVPRRQQHRKDAAYVHELDELKANVNRMGAELAGMDYMRKDFVSKVSHEIKTPVSAMMGFAEILLEDDTLSEEQKGHLMLIHDEAARVSRLLRNLLNPMYQKSYHAIALRGSNVENVNLDGTELVAKADIIENIPSYTAEHMTITMIVWVLVVVSATIIGVFYYILTLQKRRQFGIMKAIGMGMSRLAGIVTSQVCIIAVCGAVIANLLTFAMAAALPECS